jgi:uncharacterized membrane protein
LTAAKPVEGRPGLVISLLLALVFAVLYAWALHLRHSQYDTYAFDLGLLAQVVWNNLHGHWFETTVIGVNYLAEHFSPALILVSPLFLIWPNVQALLALQAVAVAGAGVGVYAAARARTGDSATALLLQTAYHLAPATGWVVMDEFHPISLALPVVTAATALLWRRHYRLAAMVALLALLANEDAAVWVAPFGLLIAIVGRRRAIAWGCLTTMIATVWLASYLFLVVPAVRPPTSTGISPPPDVGAFSWCGTSAGDVTRCLTRDPLATARRALTPNDRTALASILEPTIGLGLLGPSFLVAVPRWLVLLLGNDPPGYRSHYVALLVPAAYLAAAEAIGILRRWWPPFGRALGGLIAATSVVAFALGSPLPGGREFHPFARTPPDDVASIDRALRLIPADDRVAVSATSSILPHVALHSHVYFLGSGDQSPADFRIFDRSDPYPMTGDKMKQQIAIMRADPAYSVAFDVGNILLFKRDNLLPDRIVDKSFGGFLRLRGYSLTAGDGVAYLSLFWISEAWTPLNYHYFIHLNRSDDQGFSQKDAELVDGYLPTMQLKVGQEVVDRIVIPAPPRSAWSDYHLDVGWYNPPAGERLRLPDGQDHFVAPLADTHG